MALDTLTIKKLITEIKNFNYLHNYLLTIQLIITSKSFD